MLRLSLHLLLIASAAFAQTQTAGRYRVTLRPPPGGIYAREEAQIEFRVEDTSRPDPLTGFAAVIRATPAITIDMPSMPGMPAFTETAHAEGVPGDYGVHPTFAHGGDFRARITVHPPLAEAFAVEFPIAVLDASTKRKPAPPRFTLALIAPERKPRAGEPVELRFFVRDRDSGEVHDFDMVHESLLHLVIVRRDLSYFGHEHPLLDSDSRFRLSYTFSAGGEYRLFADVAPRGAGAQILSAKLDVDGPAQTKFDIRKMDAVRTVEVGGTVVTLASPNVVPAGTSTVVKFSVPVTDLEPYLGVPGHLMLLHEDGSTFVHSHPDESGGLNFLSRFPKPGLYRGWLQFKRNGHVCTADFLFRAETAR